MNLVEEVNNVFQECIVLLEKKNKDYADSSNPFRNLQGVENLGLCNVEMGILVRLCDKFSRLVNLISNGKEECCLDESKFDTIKDSINYLGILFVYLYNKPSKFG